MKILTLAYIFGGFLSRLSTQLFFVFIKFSFDQDSSFGPTKACWVIIGPLLVLVNQTTCLRVCNNITLQLLLFFGMIEIRKQNMDLILGPTGRFFGSILDTGQLKRHF